MASLSERFERLYERLTGRPFEGPEPPENAILKQMGEELYGRLTDLAPLIGRKLTELARERVPRSAWPYLFWVLFEKRGTWPRSLRSEEVQALALARDILIRTGQVPSYTTGLTIPPSDVEFLVDAVLRDAGRWAASILAGEMLRAYIDILRRYAPRMEALNPEVAGSAVFFTRGMFEDAVVSYPGWFTDRDMLERALAVLNLR